MACAQAAAMSLASAANDCVPLSDCDINLTVALHHFVFLQREPLVAHMGAVGEMRFVTMPRANDVDVVLVEGLAEMDPVLADLIDHLRQPHALAGRAALVRAEIAVGI